MVDGAVKALRNTGVISENIHIESVPGSWELPIATSRFSSYSAKRRLIFIARLIAASQTQASANASDLIGSATSLLVGKSDMPSETSKPKQGAFDAIIPIGVLIKGQTMHFEYISDSVSQGLMRIGLDTGVPVIFGVLTVLNDEQASSRCGLDGKSHNHGKLDLFELGADARL